MRSPKLYRKLDWQLQPHTFANLGFSPQFLAIREKTSFGPRIESRYWPISLLLDIRVVADHFQISVLGNRLCPKSVSRPVK